MKTTTVFVFALGALAAVAYSLRLLPARSSPAAATVPGSAATADAPGRPAAPASFATASAQTVRVPAVGGNGAVAVSPTAIPPTQKDARAHRDEVVAKLRASGPADSSPLALSAANALVDLRKVLDGKGDVHVAPARCYKNGCVSDVTFGSEPSFMSGRTALRASLVKLWDGPGFLSGPIPQVDGTVATSLILYTHLD